LTGRRKKGYRTGIAAEKKGQRQAMSALQVRGVHKTEAPTTTGRGGKREDAVNESKNIRKKKREKRGKKT